jgi:hypothetical protein
LCFFFEQRSDLQATNLIEPFLDEQLAPTMNKTTINNTRKEIQTRNKDAEKIEDPRLRRIGRKDTQKGRSATKNQHLDAI